MAQNLIKVIKKNSNYSQIKKYSRLTYEVRKRLLKKVLNWNKLKSLMTIEKNHH